MPLNLFYDHYQCLVGHTTSTNDDSNSGEVPDRAIYDPFESLGDTGDQVDLTTPLTKEEISSMPLLLIIFYHMNCLLDIGIKCAQLVMGSPDPLKALTHLSQNFPKFATSIARRLTVDPALLDELGENWKTLQAGLDLVWVNGMLLQNTDVNILR